MQPASPFCWNKDKPDTLELRPFGGVKLLLPNPAHWEVYNYTRCWSTIQAVKPGRVPPSGDGFQMVVQEGEAAAQ